jgi:hypothetical protein
MAVKNIVNSIGFKVKTLSEEPVYSIKYTDNEHPIIFSKPMMMILTSSLRQF